MWKVFLLLAVVASLSIVYCDDSSNDDCTDAEMSISESSSKTFQSSSSSSNSSYASSLSSSDSLSSISSSSSSMSSSSSSESAYSETMSKTRRTEDDSDNDSSSSGNDSCRSGSSDVNSTAQGSTDANSSDDQANSDSSGDDALSPKCCANEVFSNCTNGGCDARNCSQAGKPVRCVKLDPKSCIKGCVCKPDYLRASNGTCVPRNQCNEGCGDDPNAHPGCGVNCGRTCSTYKTNDTICILPCYLNGCDCNEGYVYDPAVSKCVMPEDCAKCDKPNEVYDVCPAPCPPKLCNVNDAVIRCKAPPKPGDPECKPGCRCADTYYRNATGTCVPKNKCEKPLKCNRPNEVYDACPATCPAQECGVEPALILCLPNPEYGDPKCKPSCVCVDGYVRNDAKECIPRDECPPICGLNEKYDSCTNGGCGRRNCSQLGQPQVCVDVIAGSCIKGCSCVDGYLRAANGTCVPEDQCPATGCGGDPNAQKGCGVNCGRTCSTYKTKNKALLCPRIPCKPVGCDCIEGYVFDDNLKKCVLPEQCTPICGLNEKYDPCTNGGCGRKNCSQLGQPQVCVDVIAGSCIKGCSCVDGYLKAANGTCVPEDQCPATGCGGDPNAQKGCGFNCGRKCSTYKIKNKALLCPAIQCEPIHCDCKDGYVFDDNLKKCVLPHQCTPICGPNEKYDSCTNGGCGHRNCSQLGQPQVCVDLIEGSCIKGCRCADGYLRAANGICIPQDQCPAPASCGGDPNAEPGCGVNCGRTCGTYKSKPVACVLICKVGGCDCKEGYVLDENINKCVLPKECSTTTPPSDQCPGQNEFFDTCISGCSNQSCASIGLIIHCPIQTTMCRSGCRCKPGFYRNADNVCVSESECPSPPCPEGEVYSRCPTVKCEGDYCPKTRNSPLTCPVGIVCDKPRCVCGFGRRRDQKTGKCIPNADCPPFKCDGPNEEYKSCPATCPGENCTDYIYSTKCPPYRIGIVVPCKPQCRCKQGYYRNSAGICILGSQCGPKVSTTPVPLEPPSTTAPPTTTTAASTTTDDNSGGNNSDDAKTGLAKLQAGVTEFTGKFLYDRIKAANGQNIIASPLSVMTPLAQLALYATNDSLKQLMSVLNVESKDELRAAFPLLASSFDGQTSVNFTTAGKTYTTNKYPPTEAFLTDSRDIFQSIAEALDFNAPAQAANTINKWVANKTNNLIKDLVQASDFDAMTCMVLVNVIYFKGGWLNAFDQKNTKDADFYLSDGTTKKTKLMYQQGQFNYGEVPELNCQVLEMFYKGRNFSMVIVLPKEKDGVLETAENLQDPANWNKMLGSMRSEKVKVYMPTFKIETTTDLAEELKQQGVTKIFNKIDSGLLGILRDSNATYVSKAIQKAVIEVNEAGSEAAAANGVIVSTRAIPLPPADPIVFRADHPFLFYIRAQGTTLFCGAFVK